MKTFILTDSHFHHAKLVEWGDRPENFTQIIIDNCKRMIAPEDTVIHLGDVIFGMDKEKYLKEIMTQLPGFWILIRGNHDEKPSSMYLNCGFKMVCEQLIMDGIIFSHEPLEVFPEGVTTCVHGHFHANEHRVADYPFYTGTPHYKLLALEHTNLEPVLLEEFCNISFDAKRKKNPANWSKNIPVEPRIS